MIIPRFTPAASQAAIISSACGCAHGEWLLTQHVLARLGSLDDDLVVEEVRKANGDRGDVVSCQDLSIVLIDGPGVEAIGDFCRPVEVEVRHGDQSNALSGACSDTPSVGRCHPAATDDPVSECAVIHGRPEFPKNGENDWTFDRDHNLLPPAVPASRRSFQTLPKRSSSRGALSRRARLSPRSSAAAARCWRCS